MAGLNRRFGTPHVLLTIIWIFSVAGILSGFSLETLASYSALGGLIIFLPLQISAVRLPVLYPEQYRTSDFKLKGFWLWFCPVVGILMVVFFSIIILYDLKSPLKVGGFFLFVFTGSVYYFTRKKYLLSKGIRLEDLSNHGQNWDT
jgi:APA family basic amino acid/polyamine antiporter